jgi:hypothetical protein
MKSPSDLELMLYSDGELDRERARRVRVARLWRPDVGARIDGIERVGDFVRAWARAEGVDAAEVRRCALRAVERRRALGAVAAALVVLSAVAVPAASSSSAHARSSTPPVAIETVDFGGRSGAVFVVETGSTVTPVVWLEDDTRAGA